MLRRTAWIWLAGCLAWTFDGLISLRYPDKQQAVLAFIVAVFFLIPWLFYRQQKR